MIYDPRDPSGCISYLPRPRATREAHILHAVFSSARKRNEPPKKISKLAIAAETEEDRYDLETKVMCYECGVDNIDLGQGKVGVDTLNGSFI